MGDHLGLNKTYGKIVKHLYWFQIWRRMSYHHIYKEVVILVDTKHWEFENSQNFHKT